MTCIIFPKEKLCIKIIRNNNFINLFIKFNKIIFTKIKIIKNLINDN
ncbi:MAG: hypothetical protein WC277_04920 [Bacilli bacterium]